MLNDLIYNSEEDNIDDDIGGPGGGAYSKEKMQLIEKYKRGKK